MTKILGIHEGADAGACLLINGRILASASEERFSRMKNDWGWPTHAIAFCLESAGLKASKLDCVAIASEVINPIELKIKRSHAYGIKDYINENERYWKPVLINGEELDYYEVFKNDKLFNKNYNMPYDFSFIERCTSSKERVERFQEERLNTAMRELAVSADKIRFVNHHLCHAAYAYFASEGRDKTLVIAADGEGDGANAAICIGEGNNLEEVFKTSKHNLARIYRWITLVLGMKPNEHEYKVMGLAPYAKQYIKEAPYELFKSTLAVDGIDFKYNTRPTDLYYWFKERLQACRFDGIAGGLQQFAEELMCEWVENLVNRYGIRRIVLSGGVALNIKANKAISELGCVDVMRVPPGGGDTSLGVGAAYTVAAEQCQQGESPVDIRPFDHAYLGPAYGNDAILEAIEETGVGSRYEIETGVGAGAIAAHLAAGRIIARLCGRMEFGARALGNRSILANPGDYRVVQTINEKIKNRDFWMPFTPSIKAERSGDYLINPKGLDAPYMTMAFDSTPLAQEHLAAAIHPYDKTVRPQLVSRHTNPAYYELISEFEKLTGIGALLNTSFNLHGDPVVCSPQDAIYTFENSGLDILVMNDVLIKR
jgi:carbamoyltransferase